MGVRELSQKPKELVDGDSIAEGEIDARHLGPGLLGEMRRIATHGHEGVSSRKLTSSALSPHDYFPKIMVDYQTDDNDTIENTINKSNFRLQCGWAQFQGSGANTTSGGITFPRAFSEVPIIIVGMCGAKASAGADLSDFTLESAVHVQAEDISENGFTMRFNRQDDEDNMSATSYYAASWIAIGER